LYSVLPQVLDFSQPLHGLHGVPRRTPCLLNVIVWTPKPVESIRNAIASSHRNQSAANLSSSTVAIGLPKFSNSLYDTTEKLCVGIDDNFLPLGSHPNELHFIPAHFVMRIRVFSDVVL
jgi:hypothetical protein